MPQRQPVQAAANLDHGRRILRGQGEVLPHRAGAIGEEGDGAKIGQCRESGLLGRPGEGEGRCREELLIVEMQRRAARHQQTQIGTRHGQGREVIARGLPRQVLEVVQHQQKTAVP